MITSPKITGIVPSDVLVKTAIEAALADLRANPFLLDYVFMWFPEDDLTSGAPNYGESQRQKAKDWFLKNEIGISYNYRTDVPKFPMIVVGLQSSSEAESTLGDVNYDTEDEVPASEVTITPLTIMGPFNVSNYDAVTGIITLPSGLTTDNLYQSMVLVDPATKSGYPILDVLNSSTFTIAPNVQASFNNAIVSPIDNFYVTTLESCWFKQVFKITCFCQSDPVQTLYLEQVLMFILLRYKQYLLETRGFERSTLSTGPLYLYQESDVELIWGKDVTLNGYVRHVWPKVISPKMQGINLHSISIIGGTATPANILQNDPGWNMEADGLGNF